MEVSLSVSRSSEIRQNEKSLRSSKRNDGADCEYCCCSNAYNDSFRTATTTTATITRNARFSIWLQWTSQPRKKAMFIEYAISQIRNMTDPSISISEDGSLSITSSSYDENGNYKIQSVMVRHPWTPSNGYNIDNGVMVAPNGTQVFPWYWKETQFSC